MLYVFPVAVTDAHLIDPLVEVITHLGGMKNNKCLVVADSKAEVDAKRLHQKLAEIGGSMVDPLIFPEPINDGWPKACNRYFAGAAFHIAHVLKLEEPFYWFELDNAPLRPDWLQVILSQYGLGVQAGKPFFGVLKDYYNAAKGCVDGKMMIGSGVYPGTLGIFSQLLKSAAQSQQAWDVFMRWEIAGNPANPNVQDASKYVCFNWCTCNYREVNGRIVCDIGKRPPGVLTGSDTTEITEDHVIAHGDKSGTLARIIVAKHAKQDFPIQKLESPTVPEKVHEQAAPQLQPDPVRSLIEEVKRAEARDRSQVKKDQTARRRAKRRKKVVSEATKQLLREKAQRQWAAKREQEAAA